MTRREEFEAWMDSDWPLWRNGESNPVVERLWRCWEAADATSRALLIDRSLKCIENG